MQKYLLIPFLLIFSVSSCAQNVEAGGRGKVRTGVFYSYDTHLGSKQVSFDQYIGYATDYNRENFNTGILLEYGITDQLFLNTGLSYSNKDFTGTYYCAVCDFSEPPIPQKFDLQFLEIPVAAKYYFLPKRIKPFIEAGVVNMFNISGPEYMDKNYSLNGRIGAGLDYSVSRNISVQLSADHTQNITGLFKQADYRYKVLGFRLGLIKTF